MYNIDEKFKAPKATFAIESSILGTELVGMIVNQGNSTYIMWEPPKKAGRSSGELIFRVPTLKPRLYSLYASRTSKLAENIFKNGTVLSHRELIDLKNLKAVSTYKEILVDEAGLTGLELLHGLVVHILVPTLQVSVLQEIGASFWYSQLTAVDENERFNLFNNVTCKEHFDLLCELILFFSNFEYENLNEQGLFKEAYPYRRALSAGTWSVLNSETNLIIVGNLARHFYKNKGRKILGNANKNQLMLLGTISWRGITFDQIEYLMPFLEENVAIAYRKLPQDMRQQVWSPTQLLFEVEKYFGMENDLEEEKIAVRFLDPHSHFLSARQVASPPNILTAEALLLKLLLSRYGLGKTAEIYSTFLTARTPLSLFARFVAESEKTLEAMPLDWWLALEHREDE